MKPPAPLYGDTLNLCAWLLGRLDGDPHGLARSLCQHALGLLKNITLALHGRRRDDRMEAADEGLLILRAQFRLAVSTALLTQAQFLHVLDQVDRIGRQLGGWMRSQDDRLR